MEMNLSRLGFSRKFPWAPALFNNFCWSSILLLLVGKVFLRNFSLIALFVCLVYRKRISSSILRIKLISFAIGNLNSLYSRAFLVHCEHMIRYFTFSVSFI